MFRKGPSEASEVNRAQPRLGQSVAMHGERRVSSNAPSQALRDLHGASRVLGSDTQIALPPEPQGLKGFTVSDKVAQGVTLRSDNGTQVDIEVVKDAGLAIEVRHDLADAVSVRQPFTGRQQTLDRSPVSEMLEGDRVWVEGGPYSCSFNHSTGAVSVSYNGLKVLWSDGPAFSRHAYPVRVHERLESTIPVSNERVYKPALDVGYFATLGVTFQYNRPSGPVLGLPGVTGEMNRNGYRYQLYNSDNSRHTPARQPMYQSWPVLFHKGTDGATWLGVFHDNPSRTFVDLGELHPDQVRFESVAGNSRVYIVAGDSLEEASSKLIQLLGLPPRLPLFSFGYHQCRWSFFNSGEVHETVERFQKRGVPLDAIYLDIDYMDRYRVFTTSLRDFPDLPQMSSALRKHGIATVGILDPGVKVDPGYEAYSELTAIDGALKNKQGEPLVGEAWAGASLFPDFSSTRVRDWWREKVMRWLGQNSLDGAWNDMNEPTNWRGKNDATSEALSEAGPVFEQYNLYGARMAEATHAGLLGAQPDARPFNITRSGYPGVQQHAVIWHGDNSAWWEHLQLAIDTSVSYSLAGAFYTGADVPGFGQNAPVDLAVRFFQLGAFLPFFRGHRHILSKPNEPFDFGEEAETLIQAAIHQRYSLMREWVTGFELSIREGRAPIMPVFSPEGALVKDQFMLFDTFLVAPVLQRDQSARLVMLPEGTWYRLGKPEEPIDGGRFIIEPVSLASVPVFVRAGRVITRNSVGSTVAQTLALPERHEVYPLPGAQASGSWYDDDGVSLHAVPGRLYRLVAQNGEVVRQKVEMESPEA